MDYLQYIIPILTTVLGYFFGKWDTERRRNYELEDRDYKKYTEIRDERIKEALELIDSIVSGNDILFDFVNGIVQSAKRRDRKAFRIQIDEAQKSLPKVIQLSKNAVAKFPGIAFLKDQQLMVSYNKLSEVSDRMTEELGKITVAYKNNESLDLEATVERIGKFRLESYELATVMKIRIYEISLPQNKK